MTKLMLIVFTLLLSSAAFANCDSSHNGKADFGDEATCTQDHARWDSRGDGRTPISVPEPSSLAFTGAGLVGLLGIIRRKG